MGRFVSAGTALYQAAGVIALLDGRTTGRPIFPSIMTKTPRREDRRGVFGCARLCDGLPIRAR
jgi:hypothetical protein